MTTFQYVQQKAQTLKEALEKVHSNRYYWSRKTKPLLETTLRRIKESTEINWAIEELNAESIRLVIRDEQAQEIAFLSFILTYDSRVTVDVSYYTTSYNPESRAQGFANLCSLEPGLVDETTVYTSVARFMEIILNEYIGKPNTYKDLRTKPNTRHYHLPVSSKEGRKE